jgi:molybdate transport system substrate-binding protein
MNRRQMIAFVLGLALTLAIAACNQSGGNLSTTPASTPQATQAPPVALTTAAAASLKEALEEINPLYRQANPGARQKFNFASSGALQLQIEQGAPVDVFISAAEKQMNALEKGGLILPETRTILLTNQLVLITAPESNLKTLQDLSNPEVKRIALGEPRSVPVGQYAEEVFTKEGLIDTLRPKFVLGNNVRQVLQFVESGNAQAGIVYITDAKTTTKVKVAQTIPENLHTPIVYPVAVVKASKNPEAAKQFVQYLSSPAATKIFVEKYGFGKPA